MAPNDVELVNVWTREVSASVRDLTFPYDTDFEIVVDAQAGNAIFGGGTAYESGVVVRDLSDNSIIPTTPATYGPGAMGDADWPAEGTQFVYTVAAADLAAGKENHVCEVLAWLRARAANPDVSFTTSTLFIITRP